MLDVTGKFGRDELRASLIETRDDLNDLIGRLEDDHFPTRTIGAVARDTMLRTIRHRDFLYDPKTRFRVAKIPIEKINRPKKKP